MTARIAIVGSGPAGMYAADALLKLYEDCRIDVYERFTSPFGLIRFGVAPVAGQAQHERQVAAGAAAHDA